MAGMRVPTLTTQTVQAQPLQAPMMQARVSSADGGGLAAQGMITAGQQMHDAAGLLRQHALQMAEDDARTEARDALNTWATIKRGFLYDGDNAFYSKTGKAAYDGIKGTAEGLDQALKAHASKLSPAAQKLFQPAAMAELSNDMDRMAVHASRERNAWQDATAAATVQTHINQAALETNPTLREEAINRALDARIGRAQEKGISLDDPVLQEQIATDRSTAALLALKTDMARNPQDARRYFDTVKGALSPLALAQATDMMETQRRKEEAAAAESRARWLSDFTIKLSRGELGYADVEAAYRGGMLKPDERTQAVLSIDRARKKEDEILSSLARVDAAGMGGAVVLDPKSKEDQKAVAVHFAKAASGWNDDEFLPKTIEYSAQKGMVPEQAQSLTRGWLRAGTPEQRLNASDFVQRLRSRNPQLLNDFAEEDIRMADLVSEYSGLGVKPEEAVRKAEEVMQKTMGELASAKEQYRERVKDAKTEKWLSSQLRTGLWGNATVPPAMVAELEDAAGKEFLVHGNIEAARKTALTNLQRVWGPSTMMALNGAEIYARSAPEKFYGLPGLSTAENGRWMREQLLEDLSGGAMTDAPLDGRVMLIEHPARPEDKDGRPLYGVMIKGGDGVFREVRGSDGQMMAWRPDWALSPAGRRDAQKVRETVTDAREARSRRQNPQMNFPEDGMAVPNAGRN